jgi:DNA-directed RNA polymerase specialized sigma24 family protein
MPSLMSPSKQTDEQTKDQANGHAADLYWLAFLLTGQPEASVAMAVEALDSAEGNPFFSAWMLAWSRKVVIAKALAAVRQDLAASALRVAARRGRNCARSPRNWALQPGATKVQLERALLAIDLFPRCALLLTVFEGLSVDDAAVLLDAGPELVRNAQVCAMQELTRNLAGMQSGASTVAPPFGPLWNASRA